MLQWSVSVGSMETEKKKNRMEEQKWERRERETQGFCFMEKQQFQSREMDNPLWDGLDSAGQLKDA